MNSPSVVDSPKMRTVRFEKVVTETEKAWLLTIDYGDYWIPKSVGKIGPNNELYLPIWFHNKMNDHGALFSEDGKRRFVLWRTWQSSKKIALVIGLNPSTANQSENDPTITRLISTLKKMGFGGFRMVNLFTVISSKPNILSDELVRKDEQADLGIIFGYALLCQEIIFAWGTFKEAQSRALQVIEFFIDGKCFGKNKDQSPWHPLALMYAGHKPEDSRLFKYSEHDPLKNIDKKKKRKNRNEKEPKVEIQLPLIK